MKTRLYTLLLFCLLAAGASAQVDRTFWFAAPNLTSSHTPDAISLVIVAYDDDATISITQPAAGRTLLAARRVNAHSTFTFSLTQTNNYKQTIETLADGNVHQTGILITSDADITAYYATTAPNAEVYALKGCHGLGTHFVVPQQWRHDCNHEIPAYASVEVVASEDNTTVRVVAPVPTNVSPNAGDTITVVLNRGESYALRSRTPNTPANQHLGGTIVMADKPVAVNTSDDSATTGNDKDLIGEQLVPVDLAGSRYILPANNSNNHEYAYLYAISDTTHVYTFDGTNEILAATIAPGMPAEIRLNNIVATTFYTKDDTPFILFHLTANEGGNELSGTILPSLNCSGSQEVNYVPALSDREAKVTILTRTENIDGFTVNGSTYELPAASFWPVPGDTTWAYCSCANLTLPLGYQSFNIQNNKGVFHLGILDNGGGACSYGFFSNFGHISLFAHSGENLYYVGDTLHLSLTGGDDYENIVWHGPNGDFGYDDPAPVIAPLTAADGGVYRVSAVHKEGCDVLPDSIYVSVFETSQHTLHTICTGDSITLQASGTKPFRWYADGILLPDSASRTLTVSPADKTVYTAAHGSRGASLITWTDTTDLPVQEGDSVLLWSTQLNNLIPGATYRWRMQVFASLNNAVAPKLLFFVGDSVSPLIAVPNGTAGLAVAIDYTVPVMPYPEDYNPGRAPQLRIVALACHATQHVAVRTMTFYPVIELSEEITVTPQVCKDCPAWQTVSDLGTFCELTHLSIPVEVISGEIDTFAVTFSPAAVAAGFVSRTGLTLTGDSIILPVPTSIPAGEYSLRLLTADSICDEVAYDITFTILTPKECKDCPEWNTISDLGTLCDITTLAIPIEITAGTADSFDVVFSPAAEATGFVSQSGLQPYTDGYITLPMPETPRPGKYSLTILTPDDICGNISYDITFEVFYPSTVIAQRWNDVLFVLNKDYCGYTFVSFRWYRNGEAMDVEERSWLYEPDTFREGDYYQVLLTEADGTTAFTCPFYPDTNAALHAAPEQTDDNEQWYNMQGMRITQPSEPGIYIRIIDGIGEKVVR